MADVEPDSVLLTLEGLSASFPRFRASPRGQLFGDIRSLRSEQLRQLLSSGDQLELESFNREVWRGDGGTSLAGSRIPFDVWFSETLSEDVVLALAHGLATDQVRLHGNTMWQPPTRVYGQWLEESDRMKRRYVREAARTLCSSLDPPAKAAEIAELPGFGRTVATGLTMVFHPNSFSIYQEYAEGMFKSLGFETDTSDAFQSAADAVGAAVEARNFIELDTFFYFYRPYDWLSFNPWTLTSDKSLVDMSDFQIDATNVLGYARSAKLFWAKLLEEDTGRVEEERILSDSNRRRIKKGRAARVDRVWIASHPGAVSYRGERLVHHHWDQGPWAVAFPETAHRKYTKELHWVTADDEEEPKSVDN